MGKWQIGGIEFSSKEDYKAGCRDLKRIQALAAGVDLDDRMEADELYQMLRKQPFLFESELGVAFRGYLNDKADGIKNPRGSFPVECLYSGKAAGKKRKSANAQKANTQRASAPKASVGGRNAKNAMHSQRMKLRERDIGSEEDAEEDFADGANFAGSSSLRGSSDFGKSSSLRGSSDFGKSGGLRGSNDFRKSSSLRGSGDFGKSGGLKGSSDFRETIQAGAGKGKAKKKRRRRFVVPLCIVAGIALVLFALYRIFSYDILSYISERKMEELASCILTPIEPEVSEAHRIADLIASGLYTEEEAVAIAKEEQEKRPQESVGENGILYRYSVLYGRNEDMAGWIQLPGTVINYPVMLTPQDEEYYLKKGFDKKYDINGIPFMDARCSVKEPTMNFLVYGHNMKNGSMFSALLAYEQESFYEEHPQIRFDTVYERGEYEIVGVFRTQIPYESDQEAYRYYSFIDTESEEEYDAYIRYVKEQSFYETGITAEYGTQLLTLSTCDRSVEAGRFVVVARKK